MTFRPTPSAPAAARSAVREALDGLDVDDGRVEDAALVTGVLVTHSVSHAHTKLRVTVEPTAESVTVRVEDSSQELPIPPWDQGAYSLDLVERIAQSWGFLRTDGGRQLWATVMYDWDRAADDPRLRAAAV